MDRRRLLAWVTAVSSGAAPGRTRAAAPRRATPARVGWIGWAGDTMPRPSVPLEALREGLADLGWKEGDNLQIERRQGDRDNAAALAAELVQAKVEVIVAVGPTILAARALSAQVPMVFSINGDPVEAGLVASLARPGGNLTGTTAMSVELAGKRLELLKSVRPSMPRVAVLANDRHPGRAIEWLATQSAAQRLQLQTQYFAVVSAQDFERAFAAIAAGDFGGLLAFPDTLINRHASTVADFAAMRRLPAISGWSEFALAGNLLSYGPTYRDFFRHGASFVDRILQGARPADLPVEQPTRFEFVVNRKAARAIGLTLPQAVLLRADEVIG